MWSHSDRRAPALARRAGSGILGCGQVELDYRTSRVCLLHVVGELGALLRVAHHSTGLIWQRH
jgi:hypothetical protein